MPIPEVRTSDPHLMVELTGAINRMAPFYGKVSEMGLFSGQGVATTSVQLDDILTNHGLVHSTPRHSQPIPLNVEVPSNTNFGHLHLAVSTPLNGATIQDRRAFGSAEGLMTMAMARDAAQRKARMSLDQTMEYIRSGAVQGLLRDGDGTTVYNFFTVFNKTEEVQDFNFTVATFDVQKQLREISRYLQRNGGGERITGFDILAGPTWYDAFRDHPNVKNIFLNHDGAFQLISGRDDFIFDRVRIIEYIGEAKAMKDGVNKLFIPANEARVIPLGTTDMFHELYVPSDFFSDTNQIGLPFYSKEYWADTSEKARVIETQTNPIVINARPELSVKLTQS